MIKSLENILKHKDSATYEEYKKVLSELEQKMFPDLTFKLTKKKIDGAETYSDKVDLMSQTNILNKNFPEFAKKQTEEDIELDKKLKDILSKMKEKHNESN